AGSRGRAAPRGLGCADGETQRRSRLVCPPLHSDPGLVPAPPPPRNPATLSSPPPPRRARGLLVHHSCGSWLADRRGCGSIPVDELDYDAVRVADLKGTLTPLLACQRHRDRHSLGL